MIVWDDGSLDKTKEIIYSFDEKRIHNYYDDNHGVAYARNRALEKSNGKYIAFLDSDDEWTKDKLSIQVEVLDAHPNIDVLFSDFLNINIAQNETRTSFTENKKALQLLTTEKLSDTLFIIKSGIPESLAMGNYIATDSVIMRREVFDRVGFFNEELRNSEDFELWWRMSFEDICFAFQNKILLSRYKPSNSLSSSSLASSKNTIKALDLCAQEAKEHKREDLIDLLDNPYRNAWQHMLIHYGKKRDTSNLIRAFIQSLKYGFRWGSVKLLTKGFYSFCESNKKGEIL